MLYHENLRRDLPNPDAAQYRHPPLRGITQRELEALTSFLQLLTTIITWVWMRRPAAGGRPHLSWGVLKSIFLAERKCSAGAVRAPAVDPRGGDVGSAAVQRSTHPEGGAPALPGGLREVPRDCCVALAVAGVHAGGVETMSIE